MQPKSLVSVVPQSNLLPSNVYTIQPITPLQQVDPKVTLFSVLFGKRDDAKFNDKVVATAEWLSPFILLINIIFVFGVNLPHLFVDNPTWWAIGCVYGVTLVFPSFIFTLLTMSYDIMCLIMTTFTYQYLTIINLAGWIIWVLLVRDPARSLGNFIGVIGIQLSLFGDAVYHTRSLFARCTVALSIIPPMVVICVKLGIVPRQKHVMITIGDCELDLADAFCNIMLTIVWLLTGIGSQMTRLALKGSKGGRIVCEMYHPISHLAPVTAKINVNPPLPSISAGTYRGLELDPTHHFHRIDGTKHVASSSILKKQRCIAKRGIYSSIGWIGLLAWTISLASYLLHMSNVTVFELAFSTIGLSFTTTYCIVSVAHCQPILIYRLVRQLDTWLVSGQFTLMTILVSDILKWDRRILFVWPAWMWCIWKLLLDALTPQSRQHLRYQRRMTLVVVIVLFLYPIGLSYWIYYSESSNTFERVIPLVSMPNGRTIRLETISLLSSQVVDMWIWMGRFLWREIYYPPHALQFIKQKVQYRAKREVQKLGEHATTIHERSVS